MVYDECCIQLRMKGPTFSCERDLHLVVDDTLAWRVFLHSLVDAVENNTHLGVVLDLTSLGWSTMSLVLNCGRWVLHSFVYDV